ncbi:YisB protein [Apodospora peruviana]|uniref:YisB protein n=1 Tax=Apodospora peruviana TaxID=516989 RepID=A0AAE0IAZ0_9PEZI|nr:YisB protein [Apodospora peruviana]
MTEDADRLTGNTMASVQDSTTEKNYELFRLIILCADRVNHPAAFQFRRFKIQGQETKEEQAKHFCSDTETEHGKTTAAEDLADFITNIASETFASLPDDLTTIDYRTWSEDNTGSLHSRYPIPLTALDAATILITLDPSIAESLVGHGITSAPDDDSKAPGLRPVITSVTTSPPPPSSTRNQITACEICGRDWVNLTYHHLIPRMVHAKVVNCGWHRPDELQNVAWLCGACHRFVHHFVGHEDLARRYYTVELLL